MKELILLRERGGREKERERNREREKQREHTQEKTSGHGCPRIVSHDRAPTPWGKFGNTTTVWYIGWSMNLYDSTSYLSILKDALFELCSAWCLYGALIGGQFLIKISKGQASWVAQWLRALYCSASCAIRDPGFSQLMHYAGQFVFSI